MNYILSSKGYGAGKTVARRYIGSYMATDYVTEISRSYGGRLTASGALAFDSVEAARRYKEHNNIPSEWKIVKYDSCMNALVNEVY